MLRAISRWYEQNRIKPIQAGLAISRLLRDPDDTGQVFKILEALGNSLGRALARMRADDRGMRLLEEQPNIVTALNDREALLAMPEGSVAALITTLSIVKAYRLMA